ncbi:DUF2254 domain-containing protein [Robertkochia marina]|uniref:DUF2254 domain-containing protein n=1 Tax=Robertkochia marina TaxID=1227945 RepID=A0A4S3LZF4_9FLAO|nr:DUF2254 domain-containing protein [Robertkochia marina]THD65743.1 DUF2254 domain-containing protein [Robertkochia marina]TRZ46572.1 DUF2254 domain-containing protein [Robertkochia marina]
MKALYHKLLHFSSKLQSKIAFYPTLLSAFGFLLTLIVLYLNEMGVSAYLKEKAPILVIEDLQTARTLLSAFIAGMISLMVFSFSMVMILLNQASSNFSPRLLPGLISNRRHQLVLGSFLASLIYCIFILVSVDGNEHPTNPAGFPVLVAIILTIFCLGLFVYFIHSISQSILVNNILDNIYRTSQRHLKEVLEADEDGMRFPATDEWHVYHADSTGYFQDCIIDTLKELCQKHSIKLEIIPPKGSFILEGIPLIRCDRKLEEEVINKLRSSIIISKTQLLKENYVLAFKQITEIAVKAMSPGINDPGTALNAIDYLTELFAGRMKKKDQIMLSIEKEPVIKMGSVSFQELLYNVMASLRLYCKHDVIIMQKLILMIRYLLFQPAAEEHYSECLKEEVKLLLDDAGKSISNEKDLTTIKELANTIHI